MFSSIILKGFGVQMVPRHCISYMALINVKSSELLKYEKVITQIYLRALIVAKMFS